jgi:hypothetical protein
MRSFSGFAVQKTNRPLTRLKEGPGDRIRIAADG